MSRKENNNNELSLPFVLILDGFEKSLKFFAQTQLINSIWCADFLTEPLKRVEFWLKTGTDVNQERRIVGGTALHLASRQGRLAIVKLLLKYGADMSKKNDRHNTPLFQACSKGVSCYNRMTDNQLETIKFLLEKNPGAVNQTNGIGATPLLLAIWRKNLKLVKLLLESKALVNATNGAGNTPLYNSVDRKEPVSYSKVPEIVQLLLKNGADANQLNNLNKTPLARVLEFQHDAIDPRYRLRTADLLIEQMDCENLEQLQPSQDPQPTKSLDPTNKKIKRKIQVAIDMWKKQEKEWRPRNHAGYPAMFREAITTVVKLAKTETTTAPPENNMS